MNDLATAARDLGASEMPQRYAAVRAGTEFLAASLSDEDQCVQSMPDASPAKWHQAHTTWFFEQFVLRRFLPDYRVFDSDFCLPVQFILRGGGPAASAPQPRSADTAFGRMRRCLPRACRCGDDAAASSACRDDAAELIELGLQHEQQHQELLLTDMLHAFAQNPLAPAVLPEWQEPEGAPGPTRFVDCDGGLVRIGHDGTQASVSTTRRRRISCICRHIESRRAWCATATGWHSSMMAAIARRLCGCRTVGRACRVAAGRPRCIGAKSTACGGRWDCAVLRRSTRRRRCAISAGTRPMPTRAGPDARLPTEAEWEAAGGSPTFDELTGHVWQWTASAYSPYPGYRPAAGAVGEYNGKFMINQMVLRGGIAGNADEPCATTATGTSSIRTSAGSSVACVWRATSDKERNSCPITPP